MAGPIPLLFTPFTPRSVTLQRGEVRAPSAVGRVQFARRGRQRPQGRLWRRLRRTLPLRARTCRDASPPLAAGSADLIAIGREALYDPHWALHAAQALGA
ncbi:MAG: hypothetical protein FJX57_22225, partial [Alphaproteobacteria bacterium]|nr:hypothetical protein [Alphaproteobacteria bacterium]